MRGTLLGELVAFCTVAATSIAERVGVRYNLEGWGAEDDPETATEQRGWGPLGWLARPLDPDVGADGKARSAESVSLRVSDRLEPFGHTDERLMAAANPGGGAAIPASGQFLLAHYGGGLDSFNLTAANTGAQKGTLRTMYVPYNFDSAGVAGAAMMIALNPDTEAISIVNGAADGSASAFLTIKPTEISFALDGETFGSITPGKILLHAASIALKGNVSLGAQPEAGLPLLPGVTSPPCPSLFLSPV